MHPATLEYPFDSCHYHALDERMCIRVQPIASNMKSDNMWDPIMVEVDS